MKRYLYPFLRVLALLIVALLIIAATIGTRLSEEGYTGPVSDHFDGEKFHNYVKQERAASGFFRYLMNRTPGIWAEENHNNSYPLPPQRVNGPNALLTFINHSTFLIQVDGVNILTDPIWSERASPFSFVGPKRARLPGVAFEDLPKIDVVIISHNHYDHMDITTMTKLAKRDQPVFIFGLGNGSLLDNNSISNYVELDWWQEHKVSHSLTIASVPAQHFSGRGLADRNETLWMGFVIKSSAGNIFFAGDTGFGPHFEMIRERYAPIRAALIPIGAFIPRWFMKYVHVSPQEAVQAAQVLGAQISFGMHFGTFRLADDSQNQPIEELNEALMALDKKIDFRTLDFGQSFEVSPNVQLEMPSAHKAQRAPGLSLSQ